MTIAFLSLGWVYWCEVFPQVRRELAGWQARASAIPDPELRRHALATHRAKGTHSEGAAAFAVLAPPARRRAVIRAVVAFQAMYDYLDTLSEQPGSDPLTNGWRLHAALVAALDPTEPQIDYYGLHPSSDDGGYLQAFIAACQDACAALPSYADVRPAVRTAAVRAMESQGYHHALALRTPPLPVLLAERWASAQGAAAGGLLWWEILGAAGSSLAILALISVSAHPVLRQSECDAIERLYFPWGGALLGLMDSLVDQANDTRAGQHSLTRRYGSRTEATERLSLIAEHSLELTEYVAHGGRHALILGAMASFFATEAGASLPEARDGTAAAIAALGLAATLPIIALRVRRGVGRVLRASRLG